MAISRPIECPIHEHAQRAPHAHALLSEKETLSYRQLDQKITSMQARIRQSALKKGERIALVVNDNSILIPLLFALWREGIIASIPSTRLPDESILDRCNQSGSAKLIDDRNPGISNTEIEVIRIEKLPATRHETKPSLNSAYGTDQPCTIMFTSGSTGRPKAVLHTFGNHYYSALGSNEHMPVEEGDKWLLALPLYHVAGIAILFRCFLSGAAVVLKSDGISLYDDIVHYKVTHLSLVPTQLYRLLENKSALPAHQLKAILIGGDGVADELVDKAVRKKLPIHLSYGSTEMASQIVTTGNITRTKEKILVTLPYRELKIDESGEICVKGKTLFKGYVNREDIIRPLDDQGWFHTGDTGRIRKNGLEITGRKDSMFISGGENIHPEEIERHLLALRHVEKAVVIGIDHREFGKRPIAFLQFSGMRLTDERLRHFLKKKLPGFKIPDAFYLWPEETGVRSFKSSRSAVEKQFNARPRSFTRID